MPADTTAAILVERQTTHGSFTTNAEISQQLKLFARSTTGYDKLNDVQHEALDMIALKLSRILSGQPDVEDHWADIAGYARLAANDVAARRAKG